MTDAQSPGNERIEPRHKPSGSRSDAPWLCVYTKPQAEIEALQHLRRQGFPVYLPLFLSDKRIEPLFARYLFAQPSNGSWSAIVSTRGVASVLRKPDGSAREVPRLAVERLLGLCEINLVIYPPVPIQIDPGTALRVTTTAFAELTGICSRTRDDRVWILMKIMGADREVEFTRAQVELIA